MKTSIEDSDSFLDVLNFNYKFRDIKQENGTLNNYDKINLQTDSFSSIEKFTDFISELTGSNIETIKLNIDTERFLTYSYVCIDQKDWNSEKTFSSIEESFIKYANILPADNSVNLEDRNLLTLSKWKYAKMGITKQGITLFSSSSDMNNYTILPEEYENQYFYTYIFELYKKIYLQKLNQEIKETTNIKKERKKFINFTKTIWIQEVTEDEIGTLFCNKVKQSFELDKIYYDIKNKYDTLYKELNIEKNRTTTIIISIVLVLSLIFNILNFILLSKV